MKKDKCLPCPGGPQHVTIANFERMERIWAKVRKAGLLDDVKFLMDYTQKEVVHCLGLEKEWKSHEAEERTKTLALN